MWWRFNKKTVRQKRLMPCLPPPRVTREIPIASSRETTSNNALPKPVAFFLAGAGSGAFTKTCVAPLERVKLLYQVQGMFGTARYESLGGSLRTIYLEDGVRGFYKGNGANIARILPAYSLKFMFNDTYKAMVLRPGQKAKVSHSTTTRRDDRAKLLIPRFLNGWAPCRT